MAAALSECPALVLNADYRPMSYYPLSLWSWQDALKAVFLDRVTILGHYDREVRSPGRGFPLPSVISLKRFVPPAREAAFSRFNVFLRDGFRCQYCGAGHDLTFDHVVPRSRGGGTGWDNVVTACARCNIAKGGLLPREAGMHPRSQPRRPTVHELQEKGRRFPPRRRHRTWEDYLRFTGDDPSPAGHHHDLAFDATALATVEFA